MNFYYPIIKTFLAHIFLLCLLVLSFCATCNVGKTVVGHRKNIICIDQERDALLKFKHHIQSDYCRLMSSWGNPNTPDCCRWKGVSCSNQSSHVIGLSLSGAPYQWGCLYSQRLSLSLSELKHLKYLDLSSSYFYDVVIPTSIGSLVNLTHLNLSNSGFSGNIPHQLGNLTRLTSLDLSRNDRLSATSLNWLWRLSLLRDINLSGINLSEATDWTQSIGSLVNLIRLNLSTSYISGNIPHQLGNLTSLTSLDLSHNDGLSAKSLNWLSRLSLLRDINLSGTDLSEATDWSQSIGSLPTLEVLQMDNCRLSTPITSSSILSANLRIVSLSRNYFSSPSVLQWLFNSNNYSSHEQSLEYLDLSYNSLSSKIPDAIGNIQSLKHMDLSYNSLSGSIPSTLGVSGASGMYYLLYLDLSHNHLEDAIPNAMWNCHSISYIDLSDNRLEGAIPSARGYSHSILHIDLSNNQLQGSIPSSFSKLSSLLHLDLSNNHLEGSIPATIGNMAYLVHLDLSSNNFSGVIPCKFESIPAYVNFSYNNLSGSLPRQFSYFVFESIEDFQGNPNLRTDEYMCEKTGSLSNEQQVGGDDGSHHSHDKDKIYPGLYVSIALGFYTGFWAFCGTLTLNNSWRHAYFRFIDHIIDKIYVSIAVYLARFQRNTLV